ncbi:unnamed protein product, partial [Rotaria magnacalcarata]
KLDWRGGLVDGDDDNDIILGSCSYLSFSLSMGRFNFSYLLTGGR